MSELTLFLHSLFLRWPPVRSVLYPHSLVVIKERHLSTQGQREALDDNLDYVLVSEPTIRFLSMPGAVHPRYSVMKPAEPLETGLPESHGCIQ